MFNIEVMEENGRLGSNKFLLWRPDAGFRVENAHHMKIRNCTFTQMAANGLDMVSGTNDDLVEGNVFYEIGANGIMLGKFSQDSLTEIHIPYNPTDKDEISTRDTLRYNLITNVTNEHQGAVGIGAGYPRYVVIENNEVSYTNYSGISVGYGWTKSETAMTNNKINKNNIHHISRLLCDSGPIYTLSNQGTGSEIKENYLHDYGASEWSDYWVLPIYLDEGSSGFTVENNSYKNSPSGVGQNQPGQFTQRNNGGYIESVAAAAGLQGEFKNLADKISSIPLADFSNPIPQAPFKNAFVFPALVQAEDYDEGGQGVSYSDKDIANQGNAYREDGVDVVGLECTDSAATQGCKGYAVGYTQAGEWMEYSVNVPADAKYFVKANVATASETSSFMLLVDNNAVTDTVAVPKTDSTWDVYKEIDVGTVELKQGEHVIRLLITGDYLNIDWIQFADSANQTLPPTQLVEKVRLEVSPETAYDVFGLTGKYLGRVELRGESVRNALVREGFAQGIYLVRSVGRAKALRVQVK
jgi:hypothetical protein